MTEGNNVQTVGASSFEEDMRLLREAEERKRGMLRDLLDQQLTVVGSRFAQRAEMGEFVDQNGRTHKISSYIVMHTLRELGNDAVIKMGSEMPFMKEALDEEGRVSIDESNIDSLAQRAPDWSRQVELTGYLISEPHHKFGSLLAVSRPNWIDNPYHENWDESGRAKCDAIEYQALDTSGKVGVLNLGEVDTFALDGQHRIMGIRGVKELQDGWLSLRKKNGESSGKNISREKFLADRNNDEASLVRVLDDQLAVEYVPAVLAGETIEEANIRIRSIFVSINTKAKTLTKGEGFALDESDGFAIVARNIGTSHPFFDNGSRVNWKGSALPLRSKHVTTLQALRDMTIAILEEQDPSMIERWKPATKGSTPVRPAREDLEKAQQWMTEFFDHMQELPCFKTIFSGDSIDSWRQFPTPESPDDKGHLLLRPVGQQIFARAVGRVWGEGALSLEAIFSKATRFDSNGGFEVARPANVWREVTFNSRTEKMMIKQSDRELAWELLIYLLAGADAAKQRELLDLLKERRSSSENPDKWLDFDGTWSPRGDLTKTLVPSVA